MFHLKIHKYLWENSPVGLFTYNTFLTPGMTLKRKRCQSPSPSQRKKTGRKPANEKVKLQMGAEYTGRFVAPEELESLCSSYIKKSLSSPDPNLSCDLCGYVRREREVLIQHIAVQHMDLLTIKCNICPHLGNDVNKMERHMNIHGFTREKDKVSLEFFFGELLYRPCPVRAIFRISV